MRYFISLFISATLVFVLGYLKYRELLYSPHGSLCALTSQWYCTPYIRVHCLPYYLYDFWALFIYHQHCNCAPGKQISRWLCSTRLLGRTDVQHLPFVSSGISSCSFWKSKKLIIAKVEVTQKTHLSSTLNS